jgi:PhoH-like ATPase
MREPTTQAGYTMQEEPKKKRATTAAAATKEKPCKHAHDESATTRFNRIFVLDTNVLLHDARALYGFQGVVVGIPFVVLEELDTFKRENDEKGRNAREVIRTLDELRGNGCLSQGVELNHNTGAMLRVLPTPELTDFSPEFTSAIKDNLILQTVKNLGDEGNEVTLVSKDINARVKADVMGLEAEDYTKGKVSYDEYYKGWRRVQVSPQELRLMSQKRLTQLAFDRPLHLNEFLIVESEHNPDNYRLFRFLGGEQFKEVPPYNIMHVFNARNVQQLMTLDLLMDDSIKLVTLLGPAGTGKTFLTLLIGLYKVTSEKIYQKLLVTKPVIALGADIGYLPGDVQEKLHYWMQPVHDNLEFISSQMQRGDSDLLGGSPHRDKKDGKKGKKGHKDEKPHHHQDDPRNQVLGGDAQLVDRLQQKGILSLEAITYMRGRSIPYQFVFIDEVQNLTPHEVKTIVSRAGEGTKVILAGDPYQIDSPYLDFSSNGLTVTSEKFKDQALFGTAFLETSERSELAKMAAELL